MSRPYNRPSHIRARRQAVAKMIEPIAALGLAANIAQFIEVGYKVTHILQQLRSSSATAENLELETVIKDMNDICTKLASPPGQSLVPSVDDEKLQKLVASCQKLSEELETVLQKLVVNAKGSNSRRRIEIVQKAIKSILEADKIRDLQKRLGILREQMAVHMLLILR